MYWFLISSWRLLCVSVPRSALKDRGRTELLVMPLELFGVLHSLLLLSDRRVCTLRGLAPCVLPSTVNSGMIRHWYRVRQVRGDQFGLATEIKCQRKRNEIMACATLAQCGWVCVCLCVWPSLLHICSVFGVFYPKAHFVYEEPEQQQKNLHQLPCGSSGLLTQASPNLSPRGNYSAHYSFSPLWQTPGHVKWESFDWE